MGKPIKRPLPKYVKMALMLFAVGIICVVLVCIYRYQTKIKLTDEEAKFVIEYFEMEPQDFNSNVPFQTVQYVPTDKTYEKVQLITFYTLYYRFDEQRLIRREIRETIDEAGKLTDSSKNEAFNVKWLTQNPRGAYHIAKNIPEEFDDVYHYRFDGLNIRQISYCCAFYGVATARGGKGFLTMDSLYDREISVHDRSPVDINLRGLIWNDSEAIQPESRAKAQELLSQCELDNYDVYEGYYSLPSEFIMNHPYDAFQFMLDLPVDIRNQHHEYLDELYTDGHAREWIITDCIRHNPMYEDEYTLPFSKYEPSWSQYD